jgi:hypothetical protein
MASVRKLADCIGPMGKSHPAHTKNFTIILENVLSKILVNMTF